MAMVTFVTSAAVVITTATATTRPPRPPPAAGVWRGRLAGLYLRGGVGDAAGYVVILSFVGAFTVAAGAVLACWGS